MSSGVFTAEDVDGVQYTTVDVRTLLETSLNLSLKSVCFIDDTFLWQKRKTFGLWITIIKCPISGISKLLDVRLKEFCCINIL